MTKMSVLRVLSILGPRYDISGKIEIFRHGPVMSLSGRVSILDAEIGSLLSKTDKTGHIIDLIMDPLWTSLRTS